MTSPKIAVIGLGYVGLPLAVALAKHFPTVGFDIAKARIDELARGHDRTREIDAATLKATKLKLTADPEAIAGFDLYIVTVPTPVDKRNKPDLRAVKGACVTVGRAMAKGAVVVFESTVYPGVTEDICGPALEKASRLVCGTDFFLGYSPERINPGDKVHTVDRIAKVVAGQTPKVTKLLERVYGKVTSGGIFPAASIKVAEAAKVIENAQRDINIAFINEVTMIFERMGFSTHDVLAAARTKWNFLNFAPGLVGGHCIGVDPFYLAHAAKAAKLHPAIILSGRKINDGMAGWMADRIDAALKTGGKGGGKGRAKRARILMLGLTFKEDVPDLRNSKVADMVKRLRHHGHTVDVHDPHADADEAQHEYDETLLPSIAEAKGYDCIVGAVPHKEFRGFTNVRLAKMMKPKGLVADVKGMWRALPATDKFRTWRP